MRTARFVSLLLVGVGVLTYSSWLLEFVLPARAAALHDPVWHLFTQQPFRALHGVSGIAFLLAGPPLVRLAPVQWLGRLSPAAVSTFGLLVFLDAAVPGNPAISVLLNVVFVVGATSLVLWWPPGWRRLALAGLVLVLVTWLAVLLAGDYAGLATRVQLAARAALMAVGGAYVAVVTPARRYGSRGA